jgi:hypothetical protein
MATTLLATLAILAMPTAAYADGHWYHKVGKGFVELPQGGAGLLVSDHGNVSLSGPAVGKIKCRLADDFEVRNPAEGGAGTGEALSIIFSACKQSHLTSCPAGTIGVAVPGNGAGSATVLTGDPPYKNEFVSALLFITCNGAPLPGGTYSNAFGGAIMPEIIKSKAVFNGDTIHNAESQELRFEGSVKLAGPSKEKIAAE